MTKRTIPAGCIRVADLGEHPHDGLAVAVDLDWSRKDTGLEYLVVERGTVYDAYLGDLTTDTGRIVACAPSRAAAERSARRHRRELHRRGLGAVLTVVRRDDVALRTTGQPYGCLASEG